MSHAPRGILALALLLTLSSQGLTAQDTSTRPLVLVGVGSTMPQGDFADLAKNGYHAGVGLRSYLGQSRLGQSRLGLRADAQYGKGDIKDLPAGASASWDITTLAVGLQVEATRGTVQPYFFGQWAYYELSASASMLGQTMTETLKKGGISAGGGLRFTLGRLQLYAEARYGFVNEHDGDVKFVPLSVGVTF